jgi:hypothetical protein
MAETRVRFHQTFGTAPSDARAAHCLNRRANPCPPRHGVCPFCKEDIKVDAIRCLESCETTRMLWLCEPTTEPGILV